MSTVNVSLSITAALHLLRNSAVADFVRDEIQNAVENSLKGHGRTNNLRLTLCSVPHDNKVRCIAAVRNTLGWGLRESKDFVERVIGKPNYDNGHYDSNDRWVSHVTYSGGEDTVLFDKAAAVSDLHKQLMDLGCKVFVDSFDCC